ncbi:MAG: hypothetical protein NO474_01240 [Methanomassiliicoccales archaeon]|nr:hypothetical protein [Methanomassiliicoccales archaeon]
MKNTSLEIECPVCDEKVNVDLTRCPKCGAELKSYEIGELEALAHEITKGEVANDKISPTLESPAKEISTTAAASIESSTANTILKEEEKKITGATIGSSARREKKGFFGIFGGKKR